ncbi:MAG: hypothetical protein AAGJ46_21435 [Planctomycetota bacterium]
MRSRYPLLWLKKRGKRRSGSPGWGLSGELLYHGVFIAVGAIAVWLHVARVLLPDLQQREELAQLTPAQGVVEDARVVTRAGRDQAEWRVRLLGEESEDEEPSESAATEGDTAADLSAEGEAPEPTGVTLVAVAAPSIADRDAQALLDQFPVGKTVRCWIDPEQPGRATLARGFRWWPWWMLLIPLSLVVIGVVGMIRSALKSTASVERRYLVAQHASRFDPFTGERLSVASATALPSTDDVDDSPGVKLRYRLPLEGGGAWRLAGMTLICVVWNLLVGVFLIGVLADLVSGTPNWPVTAVVMPLAAAGAWLAYALLRDTVGASGVGVSRVEIATHPIIPGQTDGGVVLQAGQFRLRWLSISLVCEEIATYCEGTDTRTETAEVYREELHRSRRFRIDNDRPFEQAFTFTVPEGAMHSFLSPHNEVRWLLEVRGMPVRWPEFRRRFRLCVYPPQHLESATEAAHNPAEVVA